MWEPQSSFSSDEDLGDIIMHQVEIFDRSNPVSMENPNFDDEPGCCESLCEKLGRLCNIILYPFMVLFTVLSLTLIVTFCVVPTLCFVTMGICAYYCFMDDPIPLNLLLRYMFSPDDTADNPFASGTGSTGGYPPRQDRGVIQAKLIVRRLIQIVDCDGGDDETVKDAKKEAAKKYPRKHPQPIWVSTESKCMEFSEPIVVEETSKGEEETGGKKKVTSRQSRGEDDGNDDDIEYGENSIASDHVPYYQRLSVPELSNRNLQETNVPDFMPQERSSSQAEIAPGDGSLSSQMTAESDTEDEGEDPPDEELGQVHISVTDTQSLEDSPEAPESRSDQPANVTSDSENEDVDDSIGPEIQICVECNSDDEDHVKPKKKKKIVATKQSMTVSETPSQKLEADYFGIESDVRDRHTVCDICLLEYEVGDEVAWSPNPKCTHTYHKDCVLDWLVRKPTCPNCRHDFTKGKKDN
jgi:hypothetical protein